MPANNSSSFEHDTPERVGVLLVNLGTPDSPSPSDVRRYLKEFLWDSRIVEMSRPLWWLILNLVILNTRPRRSAAAYSKVWTEQGSPLLVISRQQQQLLQELLEERSEGRINVALGMRYGNPSIASGLNQLREAGARQILVVPLYPQYAAATTASTFDAVTEEVRGWRWLPELRFINHYHDHAGYIQALADSVRSYWSEHGQPERLVMSFHGIPKDYFLAGDPYYCECQKTGRLLSESLGLQENQWILSFQSRLGPREWLKPYTSQTLQTLGEQGIKKVHILCPGFSADCLETLEEIAMENRDVYLNAGGEEYGYIPCLNDDGQHMEVIADLVEQHIQGWPTAPDAETEGRLLEQRKRNAVALGADG
ncbi:MAG: ferrochelatase [Gammaproteobacteria bacterium]|nr:ferrochelatase [Gammaproteobacteria bacterium]